MYLNYKLKSSDFLEYQLYSSSKSELHKKRRFRSRIIIPIIYLFLGLYVGYIREDNSIAIVFIGFAIVWFVFYPLYSRWRYKKHFQKHVKENYKNRINKPIEIDFEEDSIKTKDTTSESKINGTNLKELIETKNHYFIKLTTDLSIVIPKHSIENQTEFVERVTKLGAKYIDDLNWKWK